MLSPARKKRFRPIFAGGEDCWHGMIIKTGAQPERAAPDKQIARILDGSENFSHGLQYGPFIRAAQSDEAKVDAPANCVGDLHGHAFNIIAGEHARRIKGPHNGARDLRETPLN